MPLIDDIERLTASHGRGDLSDQELRTSLETLVIDSLPGDPGEMAAELRRLKIEAALTRLDGEFEAIRQQCMIHSRRTRTEPTFDGFLGNVVVAVVFIGIFACLTRSAFNAPKDHVWIVPGIATLILGGSFATHLIGYRKKLERLNTAREMWQRGRSLLAGIPG